MTITKEPFQHKLRFDGNDLRDMFVGATHLLESNVKSINALNVFPVPDGDTGTNMFLTLREVVRAAKEAKSELASETATVMARAALIGARGNSGVILSQFFKGFAEGLEGQPDFGAYEFACALDSARDYAYKAVGRPVEGTLLTVISDVAQAAKESAGLGKPLAEVLDHVCDAASESVALTPTLLPVLRDAGVVDAGGHGLSVILQGMRQSVRGDISTAVEISPPQARGIEVGVGAVYDQFLESVQDHGYGYCTQFLIVGHDLEPDAVRQKLAALAESTVVVGDTSTLKIHVHVDDPTPILDYARTIGDISQIRVDDMDKQHREYEIALREDARSQHPQADPAPTAVVAVVCGRGLESVFVDLGTAGILTTRETMNPSVQEIGDAVSGTASSDVILLPNNRNAIPAAQQAAQMAEKVVVVVESTTIPQGIAALLAFNPDAPIGDNVAEMKGILTSVQSGEVCRAVRSVTRNGLTVKKGQIIGLLEGEVVAATDEPSDTLITLLNAAGLADQDLVTLYWGGEITAEDARSHQSRIEAVFPGVEVGLVEGGQPYYHYIVSIE